MAVLSSSLEEFGASLRRCEGQQQNPRSSCRLPPTPLPCCCGGMLVILQTCFLSRGHDEVSATRRALNEKLMILLSNTAEEEENEEEEDEEAVGRDIKKNGHGPEAQYFVL